MFGVKVSKDESVMRLAHPQRCGAVPVDWAAIFGAYTWSELQKQFKDDQNLTPEVIHVICKDPRNVLFSRFVNFTTTDAANTELGGAYATALYLRQVIKPQPQFLIDDELVALLEYTDISDDLPMSVLKPPFPRCYIEMGKKRTCSQQVPNLTSGMHTLEGAYIEDGISSSLGPGLFITFTGSPLGKENALDDATDSVFLPTANPDRMIMDVLEEARALSQRLSKEANMRSSPDEYAQYSFSALKLLVKALLYVGLPETRKSVHNEKTEYAKQIEGKKNPAKKAKALAKLNHLADYVLIQPPQDSKPFYDSHNSGTGVRQHWRRGHYRMQPHGPQSSLRKVIFMRPQLVGTGALQEAPPTYKVV